MFLEPPLDVFFVHCLSSTIDSLPIHLKYLLSNTSSTMASNVIRSPQADNMNTVMADETGKQSGHRRGTRSGAVRNTNHPSQQKRKQDEASIAQDTITTKKGRAGLVKGDATEDELPDVPPPSYPQKSVTANGGGSDHLAAISNPVTGKVDHSLQKTEAHHIKETTVDGVGSKGLDIIDTTEEQVISEKQQPKFDYPQDTKADGDCNEYSRVASDTGLEKHTNGNSHQGNTVQSEVSTKESNNGPALDIQPKYDPASPSVECVSCLDDADFEFETLKAKNILETLLHDYPQESKTVAYHRAAEYQNYVINKAFEKPSETWISKAKLILNRTGNATDTHSMEGDNGTTNTGTGKSIIEILHDIHDAEWTTQAYRHVTRLAEIFTRKTAEKHANMSNQVSKTAENGVKNDTLSETIPTDLTAGPYAGSVTSAAPKKTAREEKLEATICMLLHKNWRSEQRAEAAEAELQFYDLSTKGVHKELKKRLKEIEELKDRVFWAELDAKLSVAFESEGREAAERMAAALASSAPEVELRKIKRGHNERVVALKHELMVAMQKELNARGDEMHNCIDQNGLGNDMHDIVQKLEVKMMERTRALLDQKMLSLCLPGEYTPAEGEEHEW